MRAVPEDAPAALAKKELIVVPDHTVRDQASDRPGRHDLQLPVALHAAGLAPREGETRYHEAELHLEREIRNLHEPQAPVAYRLAFEEAAVARQEDSPLFERLLREGAV